MNREEAKASAYCIDAESKCLVDEIYDDFENRACVNCRFSKIIIDHPCVKDGSLRCDEIMKEYSIMAGDCHTFENESFYPKADFWCNKWEKKNEK